MFFITRFLYFNRTFDSLNKVKTKVKNVNNSFEMTLNSKHRTEKIGNKNQRNRNMKNQNTERQKPSFATSRKCRLIKLDP